MPKNRRPYPPEFRARLVELVRKGRTPVEHVKDMRDRRLGGCEHSPAQTTTVLRLGGRRSDNHNRGIDSVACGAASK